MRTVLSWRSRLPPSRGTLPCVSKETLPRGRDSTNPKTVISRLFSVRGRIFPPLMFESVHEHDFVQGNRHCDNADVGGRKRATPSRAKIHIASRDQYSPEHEGIYGIKHMGSTVEQTRVEVAARGCDRVCRSHVDNEPCQPNVGCCHHHRRTADNVSSSRAGDTPRT